MAEYIEKATLVQKLHAEADKCKIGEGDTLAGLYLANCMVDELPAADVEPVRHGRWVLIRPGEWTATLKCSECGRHISVDPKNGDLGEDYPYCHCGAKMDGEDHDGNK